jgi:hypothetical protein
MMVLTHDKVCSSPVRFWVRNGSGTQRHLISSLYMHVQDFAKSLSSLEYEDDPDYTYLLRLLESLLEELGVQVSQTWIPLASECFAVSSTLLPSCLRISLDDAACSGEFFETHNLDLAFW